MRSGAVGKSGYLRLGFEQRNGRTILAENDRRIPYMAQRVIYCDEAMPELAHVFVITTTGCVLQGDRLALDVSVAAGACAHVTTQSATKIHSMDANYAAQTQRFSLAEGAYLEFLPDPLIPHRAARFISDTQVSVAHSATFLMADIIQPGRMHHRDDEWFGATLLSIATSAYRPDESLLFTEKLVIKPGQYALRRAGVMGSFDVFGNVMLCTPPDKAESIYEKVGNSIDLVNGLAFGVSRMPNGAGLIFKVAGRETEAVKTKVREFAGIVRKEVTGRDLRPKFFWR
ncbi:MAG: urease accessory protein UreD [Beijerinckiaceae bacterium]|nr:urease accessory protein UreD [Beijerinckiaceae bacterium]